MFIFRGVVKILSLRKATIAVIFFINMKDMFVLLKIYAVNVLILQKFQTVGHKQYERFRPPNVLDRFWAFYDRLHAKTFMPEYNNALERIVKNFYFQVLNLHIRKVRMGKEYYNSNCIIFLTLVGTGANESGRVYIYIFGRLVLNIKWEQIREHWI